MAASILDQQLDYFRRLIKLSQSMLDCIREDKVDAFELQLENRERLIGLIEKLDQQISEDSTTTDQKFAAFKHRCSQMIQLNAEIDSLVIEELEKIRKNVAEKISPTVFKKEALRGYNLSSTKSS